MAKVLAGPDGEGCTLEWPADLVVLSVECRDGTWTVTFGKGGDPAREPIDILVVDGLVARAIRFLLEKVKG